MTARSGTPQFFLDRGLGARIVPGGRRARGWLLTTMDERYGADRSQQVADVDWIREASARGECLLTKDVAIARNPSEAQMVVACDARVFAITNSRITGPQMLARLIQHEAAVFRWAQRSRPPFVLGLGPLRAERLRLNLR
jgi:hypothetical protein